MALRRGIGNCHGITNALRRDLKDAGWAQSFAFKRGSCEVLKSEHDPDGLHSWLEINGWAIDVANGASRPVIIMPTDAYYNTLHVTNVEDQQLRRYSLENNSARSSKPRLASLKP
jgi:hypothetical protein